MNYRNRIQIKDSNEYQVTSIEYLKGVLHTYSDLNRPNSNLDYEYEIIELYKSENIIKTLKKEFYVFENQQIELELISEIDFKSILQSWFFNNGSLTDIKLNDSRKESEIQNFVNHLKSILKITEIYKIENLKSSLENQFNELGVFYQYLLLSCQKSDFILYFRYDD
ncbi:hypothetical protein [Mesonia sp. K4-1]|uniref:hypothetical protein n=1 Tax=Mesonia sp. K4-1 TaxID=2602760 RepID=UPI0011C9CC3E|nr:hypothetical protein [Mesonia sp. K4-1]TXK74609.1 hypothetical protein FT986_11310 [Mesonia sp. K4-1]